MVEEQGILSPSPEMPPPRPGVPDEIRAFLPVAPELGAAVGWWKWSGDRHAGFDAVARHLGALCRPEGELIYAGPHDWEWRPEGREHPA